MGELIDEQMDALDGGQMDSDLLSSYGGHFHVGMY